jgi:hypothetical protein
MARIITGLIFTISPVVPFRVFRGGGSVDDRVSWHIHARVALLQVYF